MPSNTIIRAGGHVQHDGSFFNAENEVSEYEANRNSGTALSDKGLARGCDCTVCKMLTRIAKVGPWGRLYNHYRKKPSEVGVWIGILALVLAAVGVVITIAL